jgi:hypothetical protein
MLAIVIPIQSIVPNRPALEQGLKAEEKIRAGVCREQLLVEVERPLSALV